jgi:chemotaxis protein methyltransferase CheR
MMNLSDTLNVYSLKLEEPEFKRIQTFMLDELGIKLSPVKIVMVNSRLVKRLKATQMDSFAKYLDYALSEEGRRGGEFHFMVDELTTHKTEFFREPEQFVYLNKEILPKLSEEARRDFKIWSAGCSTGEEPYTMGILLNEFAQRSPGFKFSIYASDISSGVLTKAVRAIYNQQMVDGMSPEYIRKYFLQSKDQETKQFRVVKSLRDSVYFFKQNLVDNYFFSNNSLDIAFCRNTLIYFEEKSKKEVVEKLVQKIKPGGYLFVGLSETLTQYSSDIKQVSPSIYLKK